MNSVYTFISGVAAKNRFGRQNVDTIAAVPSTTETLLPFGFTLEFAAEKLFNGCSFFLVGENPDIVAVAVAAVLLLLVFDD